MLSDSGILTAMSEGGILLSAFETELLQPASIDVTLAGSLLMPCGGRMNGSDISELSYEKREMHPETYFSLWPGDFAIASTEQHIMLSASYAARVEGKSSLGRLGLAAHITAGFIDPGFNGNITLELKNNGPWVINLWAGMRIAQLCFFRLDGPARRPYGHESHGSKYQGQSGPTPARG